MVFAALEVGIVEILSDFGENLNMDSFLHMLLLFFAIFSFAASHLSPPPHRIFFEIKMRYRVPGFLVGVSNPQYTSG